MITYEEVLCIVIGVVCLTLFILAALSDSGEDDFL